MAANNTACSTKWPPKLESDCAFEAWKKDINIWCELCELPKEKQALAIHLSLSGRARVASSEIEVEVLKRSDGVEVLLRKLDGLFLQDKGRRQFDAFRNLYDLRRRDGCTVSDFVCEFEHVYFKFTEEGMQLPDAVMAFMLVAACKLNDNEVLMVMSAISDVSYENIKSSIKRIFALDLNQGSQASMDPYVKAEPTYLNESEVFYNRNRASRPYNCDRYESKQGRKRLDSRQGWGNNYGSRETNMFNKGRKLNPVDSQGRVSRCVICDSCYHWARNCPHSYENLENTNNKCENNENNIHLSLFNGYTDNQEGNLKIKNLMKESDCCAVLDTGCSSTVCGIQWLQNYLGALTEYQKSLIVEKESSSSFTFGGGLTFPSSKRVKIPCIIGGLEASIETDVVECNIPLLLSNKSMKKAKMTIDFSNDVAIIQNKKVTLRSAPSGHYLIPLSI